MKNLIILLLLLFVINSFSQTQTEKWNSLYNRYEYFNSNGTMIGYKKYNSLYDRWEYYDLKTNNSSNTGYQIQQPVSSVDLELIGKVLNSRQAKYDYNVSKIKETIEICKNHITSVWAEKEDVSDAYWNKYLDATKNFETAYVSKVGGYDLSNNSTFQQVDKFLRNGAIKIVCHYFNKCN